MTCLLSSLITDRFTCTRRRLICVWRQTVNCLAGPRHVVRVLNWMILRLRPSSDSCLVETVLGIGPPARNLAGQITSASTGDPQRDRNRAPAPPFYCRVGSPPGPSQRPEGQNRILLCPYFDLTAVVAGPDRDVLRVHRPGELPAVPAIAAFHQCTAAAALLFLTPRDCHGASLRVVCAGGR